MLLRKCQCGRREPVIEVHYKRRSDQWRVRCEQCGRDTGWVATFDVAVATWNQAIDAETA